MYVTVIGRIFTKLNACLRNFHMSSYNECYEKSFNGLVADAWLLVDGRAWSAYKALFFLLRRERLI